jgi:VWA domain-containing protein
MGILVAVTALALLQAPPASPPAAPVVEETTRTVDFRVTGEKGAPVEGLTADEVVVMENGNARNVLRVQRDTRPLTVAILVDTSAPQATNLRLNIVKAVGEFVRKLPEGARYSLWATGDRPLELVEVTDNRGRVVPALSKVYPSGGNVLLDALMEVSEKLQKMPEGERVLMVVVTGVGIGFASQSRNAVVDEVRRRKVPVMAVQFDERGADAQGESEVTRFDYDYVLGNLTKGGVYERPLSSMGVDTALDKVAAALAGSYRATYSTPEGGKPDKLDVQVARPGVKVQVGGDTR